MIHNKTRGLKLLLAAGAQAAAQGAGRTASLSKLLPIAGAAGFVLRMFRKGRTETRPAAGNRTTRVRSPGLKRQVNAARTKLSQGGHSHE